MYLEFVMMVGWEAIGNPRGYQWIQMQTLYISKGQLDAQGKRVDWQMALKRGEGGNDQVHSTRSPDIRHVDILASIRDL